MDLSLVYSGLTGFGIGIVASIVLNIYSVASANKLSYSLFGVDIVSFITTSTLFTIGLIVAFLSGCSILIRDLAYPRAYPIKFTIETLLMAALSSLVIFIMTVLRGYKVDSDTWIEYTALFVKFGLLHILLQFCGVYSSLFPFKP
jgi:hypothetical protein